MENATDFVCVYSENHVSKFSPTRSTLENTFSSIHASTLRSISPIALPSINKCVASKSSNMNFLSTVFISSNCRMNCLVGGSHVNKNPEDSTDVVPDDDRLEDDLDVFFGDFPEEEDFIEIGRAHV